MYNACIGEFGNTPRLLIVVMKFVFRTTPFWALVVYGFNILVYGRIPWRIRPYT